jgi:hypothetical protein
MKTVRTITIIDNNDGMNSQYVHISNIEGRGTELEVKKAMVNIERITYPNQRYPGCYNPFDPLFKINIEIDCFLDKDKIAYQIFKKDSMDNISNDDLLKELKKRNLLSEETIYKINK